MIDVFDKTYVINLVSRKDRLAEMSDQLKSIGTRFDSRLAAYSAVQPREQAGFRTIGAHGCFRSHLGILEQAARDGLKSVLILEDDVNFARNFSRLGEPVKQALQSTAWDVFYGGHEVVAPATVASADFVAEGLRRAPHDMPILLAHFVAFRGNTIPRLVDYLNLMLNRPAGHPEGGPMDVDGAYNWFRKSHPDAVTLLADPQLGFQRASVSDITPGKWFNYVPALSSAAAAYRKLRNWQRSRSR
jgi:glycosyl transferase, family 25